MKAQTQHMIMVLKATIRGLGFTNREIERRLGVSRGYLTRLFSGVMDLRFDQVSEIAEAMGIEPEEIFHLAYPPTKRPATPEVQRLRESIAGAEPVPPQPGDGSPEGSALERELERIVARTFKKMFSGMEKMER